MVDVARLGDWMDQHGFHPGRIERVTPIGGGTQNVMVRFERAGRSFILRRGPRHLREKSNDALRREIALLDALASTEVPHPRLIAACTDESVLGGAVFYLMEPVDGFNAAVELPEPHSDRAEMRRAMGLRMVDALAQVGAVDHHAVGLGGFGKAEGFLERQVARWMGELDSYRRLAGYPGPEIPDVERVASWLDRNRPSVWTPGILHGDYHVANVMFAHGGPDIVAIVDWEMSTIGDPLLDLGWLLSVWPEDGTREDKIGSALARAGGLPTQAEMIARYAERSARDLSAITWYTVLACFKLGIVLEGTHARAFAGKAPKAVGDRLHATTLSLFDRARRLISA